MVNFYTYLWLREDGTPYYVGKGKGNRGLTGRKHRQKCPPKDRILIQEFPSEEAAFEAEKFLIACYGRLDNKTGCLSNLTDGGEGVSPKEKCKYGHLSKYAKFDSHGDCSVCLTIKNLWARGWSKKRFSREEWKRSYITRSYDPRFCKFGHAKTSENIVRYNESDSCKICRLIRNTYNNAVRTLQRKLRRTK